MWKKPLNKELAIKYYEKLKETFENIKNFISISEEIIKGNKEISKNEKDFMLEQLNIYRNLNKWKF